MFSSESSDFDHTKNRWIVLKGKILGEGTFSKVYEGRDQTDPKSRVAIKVVAKQHTNDVKNELEFLIQLKKVLHPNLIEFHDFYFGKDDQLHLVIELCAGKSLRHELDQLKSKRDRMSEKTALGYGWQILNGLKCLHEVLEIIHKDLKPENLLFQNDVLKIADFGLSIGKTEDKSKKGTPLYMPPEYSGKTGTQFTQAVDIWAFGIIMHEMLSGEPPFYSESLDKQKLKWIIQNTSYIPPNDSTVSDQTKEMIKKCLHKRPEKRPSVEEILNFSCFKDLYTQDFQLQEQTGSNIV